MCILHCFSTNSKKQITQINLIVNFFSKLQLDHIYKFHCNCFNFELDMVCVIKAKNGVLKTFAQYSMLGKTV